MPDHTPSIFAQGVSVRRLHSPHHTYNSGFVTIDGRTLFCSRAWNSARRRSCLIWQELGKGDSLKPLSTIAGLNPAGWEDLEDARIVHHDGALYLAYTDADYRGWDRGLFIGRQGLARLDDKLKVRARYQITYGNNFKPPMQEKNWQFFSHNTKLFCFVYSISPHVVVAVHPETGRATAEWKSHDPICWPWGKPSGGTPPIRVGDEYVSFFHSFVSRKPDPKDGRFRRYVMAAYAFEAKSPFNITRISHPILRASTEDESISHPGNPNWNPIVIFPINAEATSDGWRISAGVNDSYDVMIDLKASQIRWEPIAAWAEPRARTYATDNSNTLLEYYEQHRGSVVRRWKRWTPAGPMHGGARGGTFTTADGNVIEALEGMAAKGLAREVQPGKVAA